MRTRPLAPLLLCSVLLGASSLHGADLPLPEQQLPPLQNSAPTLGTSPAGRLGIADILPPDRAFALQALPEADGGLLLLWDLPAGYYLYQQSLQAQASGGTTIALELPEAIEITDEYFGAVAVYYERVVVRIAPEQLNAVPGTALQLLLSYQGCAENLYCYPLQQKNLSITLPE